MTQEPGAGVHPLDEHRDPVGTSIVRGLAAEVAARYGGNLEKMRRANGYSNATWVGMGIAVRIAHTPVDMAREVALVRALPPEVRHPEILGTGTLDGHGWIVSAEVPGRNLHEAWPTLTSTDRERAVDDLWARVQFVHRATRSLQPLVTSSGGFVPPTPGDALATARRLGSAVRLSSVRQSRLHEVIDGYFRAAPSAEQVVNHGDLALMNALWDGGVVALLDFEFAVLGPLEIDLCRLLLETLVTDDGNSVTTAAGKRAVDIATRCMDSTHGRVLVHGAAVLDQLRDLDIWLATDSGRERPEDWRPYRLLIGLLDTEGGFLAPVLRSHRP